MADVPVNTPHSIALDQDIQRDLGLFSGKVSNAAVEAFVINLAVCNTVVPSEDEHGRIQYQVGWCVVGQQDAVMLMLWSDIGCAMGSQRCHFVGWLICTVVHCGRALKKGPGSFIHTSGRFVCFTAVSVPL